MTKLFSSKALSKQCPLLTCS